MKTISAAFIVQDEEDIIEYSLHNPLLVYDKIIIIDGGSKDRTIEKIWNKADQLGMRHKIELYHNRFSTLNEQRNFYLRKCKTEYVQYIDADEIFTKENLEKIKYEYINNYECILVRSHHFYIDFWHWANGHGWEQSYLMPRIYKMLPGIHYTKYVATEGDHTLFIGQMYFMKYFNNTMKICDKDDIVCWHYGHAMGRDHEREHLIWFTRYDHPELNHLSDQQISDKVCKSGYFDRRFWEDGINCDPKGIVKFTGEHPEIIKSHPLYNIRIIKD